MYISIGFTVPDSLVSDTTTSSSLKSPPSSKLSPTAAVSSSWVKDSSSSSASSYQQKGRLHTEGDNRDNGTGLESLTHSGGSNNVTSHVPGQKRDPFLDDLI